MFNQDRKILEYMKEYKGNRCKELSARKEELENLIKQFEAFKISKFIRRHYYNLKRYLLLIIGLILIMPSVIFLIFPENIFLIAGSKESFMENYFEEYSTNLEKSLISILGSIADDYNYRQADILSNHLEVTLKTLVEEDILNIVKSFSVLLLLFSLTLLYISKTSKDLYNAYKREKDTEKIVKKAFQDHSDLIKSELEEISKLEEYLKK